jgi:divalent metal cation (Fe/Co/Zn/Cd) transporter
MLSTMIALKIGRKLFDQEHPYGHGKAESIAAIMVSLVIFATGVGIHCGKSQVWTYHSPDNEFWNYTKIAWNCY